VKRPIEHPVPAQEPIFPPIRSQGRIELIVPDCPSQIVEERHPLAFRGHARDPLPEFITIRGVGHRRESAAEDRGSDGVGMQSLAHPADVSIDQEERGRASLSLSRSAGLNCCPRCLMS